MSENTEKSIEDQIREELFEEDASEDVKLTNCKLCGDPTVGDICRSCEMLQEIKVL